MNYKAVCRGMCLLPLTIASALLLTGCGSGSFWQGASTSTTTTLGASTTKPVEGASVTLTATISPSAATGTVTFYDGSTSLGIGTLSGGTATLATAFSTTGAHSLTATYGGSSTYAASTSSVLTVTVSASAEAISTDTTLVSTSYSTTAGTAFTLTGTVTVASTGDTATAATGSIEFYDVTTSKDLGTVSISSGVAQLSTNLSAVETHSIKAIYTTGDTSYASSTSSEISIVISSSSSSGSSTTTVALSVSPTYVTYGTGVALAAIVTPLSSTGTVTFYDNSTTEIGTASLVSGSAVAALTVTSLAVGSHSITASYNSITSNAATVTVISAATAGSFLQSTSGFGYNSLGYCLDELGAGTLSTSGKSYTTTAASDQSAICITGTSTYLTLLNPAITSSSVTNENDDSSFYGLDAAVLDYNGGDLTMDGATVTTSGAGGNMVFSYGTGSVTISNSTLSSATTSTSNNHGIYAAGGGAIVANNVTATSAGGSSSIVATDSGGGTVTINGGTYEAEGGKSAGIYSTGSITAYNATFTSTIAEAVVIEGANLVKLYNSTLNAGSLGSSNSSATHRGIMLYQSGSGDATNSTCGSGDCFYMTNGSFNFYDTYASASSTNPSDNCTAIEVYNQTSMITLTDVTVNNSCGTLLLSAYNNQWSNSDAWGKATLYAYGATMTGNVIVGGTCTVSDSSCTSSTLDTSSTAAIYLYKDSYSVGSTLTGAINTADTGKTVSLTMDAASTWVVTGTSYLTALTDADSTYDNITCQTSGCKVYVGSNEIK